MIRSSSFGVLSSTVPPVSPELEDRLKRCDWGFSIDKELSRKYGVEFADNRYGDVIFVSRNGILLEPNSWGSPLDRLKYVSMRGYDPFNKESSGIFITDLVQQRKLRAIDILPLATTFLGLEGQRGVY
ncbi:MAG: hypothetical protein ABSG74_09640 [Candidatus Bathyarchaeia archaeon]